MQEIIKDGHEENIQENRKEGKEEHWKEKCCLFAWVKVENKYNKKNLKTKT